MSRHYARRQHCRQLRQPLSALSLMSASNILPHEKAFARWWLTASALSWRYAALARHYAVALRWLQIAALAISWRVIASRCWYCRERRQFSRLEIASIESQIVFDEQMSCDIAFFAGQKPAFHAGNFAGIFFEQLAEIEITEGFRPRASKYVAASYASADALHFGIENRCLLTAVTPRCFIAADANSRRYGHRISEIRFDRAFNITEMSATPDL